MESASGNGGEGSGSGSGGDVINLQNVLLRLPGDDGEESDTYQLSDFLDDEGKSSSIKVASYYNYEAFRNRLFEDLEIPKTAPLYPPLESGVINITNAMTWVVALTQIQGDSITLVNDADGLALVLTTEKPVAGQQEAQAPPGQVIQGDQALVPEEPVDDNILIRDLGFGWADIDDGLWKQVCQLFCCNENATSIRVRGMNVEIEPYQAVAIYKALEQCISGSASFIIGDDVGL
ncbi:hypothetical protein NUW58_g771 [Xylaria curta]|uniref:Uncharacterized protein n=1 Tax=Xylaria curta TaxID=42375 RepID=A0ACC1PN03_9PEZI|nr:hypothetical protein NUW58_g771 [Xylaria curta]